MTDRRNLLFGAACALAAGTAFALQPRNHVSLLGQDKIDNIIPKRFGAWAMESSEGILQPKIEGSLADRLYAETVARSYRQQQTGELVMLLIAHGPTQTDLMQLHRPESCYPAFGFNIVQNRPALIPLSAGVAIPGRNLTATAGDWTEYIVYWARLGEALPISSSEQAKDRLRMAMEGYVADGLLVRGSISGGTAAAAFKTVNGFFGDMIKHVQPRKRTALIGTKLANKLSST